MHRSLAAPLLAAAIVLPGCTEEDTPPPSGCFEGDEVRRALDAAPAEVRLADGTALSRCVRLSTNDDQLQSLGLVLTAVADELADRSERGDTRAAARLGFLLGAAEQGASKAQGVQLELVRRLESAARRADAAGADASAALRQGRAAGVSDG
jgi:hypothetical protein